MTHNQPNDYMEKCPWCHQFVLSSQIEQHICDAPLIDVKEIPVLFSYITTDRKGNKVTIARGYDGVLYRLVKSKNPLSDDWKHLLDSDGEVTVPIPALYKGGYSFPEQLVSATKATKVTLNLKANNGLS